MKKTIGIILTLPTLGVIVGALLYSIIESPYMGVVTVLLTVGFVVGVELIRYN